MGLPEVPVPARFLEAGAFHVQGMLAVPSAEFLRPLGALPPASMADVETTTGRWLGLTS